MSPDVRHEADAKAQAAADHGPAVGTPDTVWVYSGTTGPVVASMAKTPSPWYGLIRLSGTNDPTRPVSDVGVGWVTNVSATTSSPGACGRNRSRARRRTRPGGVGGGRCGDVPGGEAAVLDDVDELHHRRCGQRDRDLRAGAGGRHAEPYQSSASPSLPHPVDTARVHVDESPDTPVTWAST